MLKNIKYICLLGMALFMLNSCDDESTIVQDALPVFGSLYSYGQSLPQSVNADSPVPGASGALTFSSVSTNTVTISWEQATDGVTASSSLNYTVYYSTSNNISTADDIVTNAADSSTSVTAYGGSETGITSKVVTGLTDGTRYYFNVLVTDEDNNNAVYTARAGVLYLFYSASTTGDLKGSSTTAREGADALCATAKTSSYSSLNCSTVKAVISVDATDEIQDMATLYSIPTVWPIYSAVSSSLLIDTKWGDMLTGNIYQRLELALSDSISNYWTGSDFEGVLVTDQCTNWTSADAAVNGGVGDGTDRTQWLQDTDSTTATCDSSKPILCVCW